MKPQSPIFGTSHHGAGSFFLNGALGVPEVILAKPKTRTSQHSMDSMGSGSLRGGKCPMNWGWVSYDFQESVAEYIPNPCSVRTRKQSYKQHFWLRCSFQRIRLPVRCGTLSESRARPICFSFGSSQSSSIVVHATI